MTNGVAGYEPRAPIISVDRIPATPSSYRLVPRSTRDAEPAAEVDPSLTPEMQRAVRSLREMPPFAREREIEAGRFSSFTSEEKEFLLNQDYQSRAK
jgi:hypothetical protein